MEQAKNTNEASSSLPASYKLTANDPRLDTSAPSTDEIVAATQDKAVILQPEKAATVFRKKLDKEMDELLPAPPNFVQKALRIIGYPLCCIWEQNLHSIKSMNIPRSLRAKINGSQEWIATF